MSKQEQKPKTKGKSIFIPVEQYRELEEFAKKHDLTVDQLANQLLEKEIVDEAHKELFIPGLKWDMPKSKIIMARILSRDLPKLRKWLQCKDRLAICPHEEEGELFIINETEVEGNE